MDNRSSDTRISLLEQRMDSVEKEVKNMTDMRLALQRLNSLMEVQQGLLTEVRDSTQAQTQASTEQQIVIADILKTIKAIEKLDDKVLTIEKKVGILESRTIDKSEKRKYLWGFWTAIGVAVLGVIGTILGIVL